jgi:hypothetical protein
VQRGRRRKATSHGTALATSAWTIANVAFDGKKEATPFACGQFAWNSLHREIDEILGA